MEGELVVFLLFSFPAVWWRVWREENYERSLDQNLEEFFKTKSCPNKQAVLMNPMQNVKWIVNKKR